MPKPPLRDKVMKKKVCTFCKEKNTQINYKDTTLLRKYVSDRGKIRARRVTGNCVLAPARRCHCRQELT